MPAKKIRSKRKTRVDEDLNPMQELLYCNEVEHYLSGIHTKLWPEVKGYLEQVGKSPQQFVNEYRKRMLEEYKKDLQARLVTSTENCLKHPTIERFQEELLRIIKELQEMGVTTTDSSIIKLVK